MVYMREDVCRRPSPYTDVFYRFLHNWIYDGNCSDPYEEFIIDVDPLRLESKGKFQTFDHPIRSPVT